MKEAGKLLMVAGSLIVLAGLVLYLFSSRLKWLGHLPGDIRVERPGFRFFAPLASMLILSLLLSLLVWLIQRFLK